MTAAQSVSAKHRYLVPLGLFLAVAAVYLLTSPGRIDIIDGQWRFDVARNVLRVGEPVVSAPFLVSRALRGRLGAFYVAYGFAGSLAQMPLVALARVFDDPKEELARCFSSFTSPIFGAAVAPVLYRFHRRLGVAPRRAVMWTLVSAFATLLWPTATTTFDNAQHAFLITLAAYLGWRSANESSRRLALGAGLVAGMLLNYQESFVIVLPALGLVVLAPPHDDAKRREGFVRYGLFAAACAIGLSLWLSYNYARFGSPFYSGRLDVLSTRHPPLRGNPIEGISSLLASPGRSVFLYSPTLFLGIVGLRAFARRARRLVHMVVVASVVHLAVVGSLSLFAGEWCWGPRYLVGFLPLWSLAFPYAFEGVSRAALRNAIVIAGLLVQLLAVSIEPMRFHNEHKLDDFFWATEHWFYFRHSALASRVSEIASTIREGVPREARYFAPSVDMNMVTLCPMRLWTPDDGPRIMRWFSVYYLPRPWPFWMRTIPDAQRPLDPTQATAFFLALGLLGMVFVRAGVREELAAGDATRTNDGSDSA